MQVTLKSFLSLSLVFLFPNFPQPLANHKHSSVFLPQQCSRLENYKHLRREDDNGCVTISNPKTQDFQIGRTTLLVGLLKTISNNKKLPVPIKLYEIADVILRDENSDVGAINQRRVAAVISDVKAGFENLHGLLDILMLKVGVSTDRYYLDPASCTGKFFFCSASSI